MAEWPRFAEPFYEPSELALARWTHGCDFPAQQHRAPVGRCATPEASRPPPAQIAVSFLLCAASDISVLRRQIFDPCDRAAYLAAMTVHPLRPVPVLTMQAMDEDQGYEAALSLPLPETPSIDLLGKARSYVLAYLDFVSHNVAPDGDAAVITAEINRAAARLIEIALHWQSAAERLADMPATPTADRDQLPPPAPEPT
jgi:hypothetical protein